MPVEETDPDLEATPIPEPTPTPIIPEPTPTMEVIATPVIYDNQPIIDAIHEQTASIHLQFAVLIAILIFLKIWKRGK